MSADRKPDQVITTRVTIDVHSARPLPPSRLRAWLRPLEWNAVSLHPDRTFKPEDREANEEGWEYIHFDVNETTIEEQTP